MNAALSTASKITTTIVTLPVEIPVASFVIEVVPAPASSPVDPTSPTLTSPQQRTECPTRDVVASQVGCTLSLHLPGAR